MYQKLNQSKKVKVLLATLAFLMSLGFVLSLPLDEVAAQSPMGLPFGGRVTVSVATGYPWTLGLVSGYCPPHLWVVNFGPSYLVGQPFAVFFPPASPRAYYNYFTPGVAITGFYYPVPNLILCPFYPVYYSSLFGTSLLP